jgi:glutamate-ammonia-ligase adenylyltransferase
MATCGVTLDLLANLAGQLANRLSDLADPDMALNNLERFVLAARNPLAMASLFERDPQSLSILLVIFSTSQHLSDLLITDHESYDLLRLTEGTPVYRDTLADELAAEVAVLTDERDVLAALRRFKRRETLRIAYGDIVKHQRLEVVTSQISFLAEALIEAAVQAAWRRLAEKRGQPRGTNGSPARFTVLGMGKLGGAELNYSSDVDLIFLYDVDGETAGPRPVSNGEFFDRLAREVVRLLTETTELGTAWRVDMRLRPEGERGPFVCSLEQALHYYDVLGRTWERQAYIKARPVAGDRQLGEDFLSRLEPWIYRKYLGLADITGIKALKRRIEQRAAREGAESLNVKTGHGGIRDVEFAIQFLQLLNGGDLADLRTGNTLSAIGRLEQVGCLNPQEASFLTDSYVFLRRIEHLLQIMFDLQTHELPARPDEVRKLALRMGYRELPGRPALESFEADYRSKTDVNRRILDHLLHDAFPQGAEAEPEVDLILDPDPSPGRLREVLSKYGFRDVDQAYKNLMALASEKVRFLSTRRCRHFLASITPGLLSAVASTSDPDSTLVTLEQVSDSVGGKGILWELFSFNPPTLKLYVEICATSPFLSGLLISNPGMIDELMDSLVLNKLPSQESLRENLAELCRAAEDIDPILHSFKNTCQLQVGVRDLLGKEDLTAITAALSGIAEVCLEEITAAEFEKLAARFGEPMMDDASASRRSELVIVALGKFGGRELSYHSDLDLVFLFEADGETRHTRRLRGGQTTTNPHFYGELASRVVRQAGRLGPLGRLYNVDPRLRPTGRNGPLATSLDEFERYFEPGGGAQLWERQALTKARIVYGEPSASARARRAIEQAAFGPPWQAENAAEIRAMRARLEHTALGFNLKRGLGGIVDVEFLAQMLVLKHGRANPAVIQPGTLAALSALESAGFLAPEKARALVEGYRFLRTVEGRLRLMSSGARDEIPEDKAGLARLARAVGFLDSQAFLSACQSYAEQNRAIFDREFDRAGRAG